MNEARAVGPTSAVFARTARETRRDPVRALVIPAMPSLLMAVTFTALFGPLSRVVDFPTGSFDEYLVPGLVLMAGLVGGGYTSSQLASDLRTGFLDRLRLHLHRPMPVLMGRFAFEAVRVLPAALVVLAVGLALGGTADNGIAGIAVLLLITMLVSTAYAGLFYVAAIKTRDPQTPLNLQPISIVLFFISSAIVPLGAMPGWTKAIARVNPITAIADGAREAMIGDLASNDVLVAVVVTVSLLVLAVAGSTFVPGARDGKELTVSAATLMFARTARHARREAPVAFGQPILGSVLIGVVFGAIFGSVDRLAGFPATSYLDWLLPGTLYLAAVVGAGFAAAELLEDIETGYLERIRLSPASPRALLAGRIGFELSRGVVVASVVLVVGLARGAENHSGPAGAIALVLLTAAFGTAWNGLFFVSAITTRNPAAVFGMQPLFLPVMLFSTWFGPRSLMPRWFETIARLNPVTAFLDAQRSILTGSTDRGLVGLTVAFIVALAAGTFALALRAYDRLAQTS